MAWKVTILGKLIIGALSICLFMVLYLSISTPPISFSPDRHVRSQSYFGTVKYESQPDISQRRQPLVSNSNHHLTVIVPFRNRFEELLTFSPYLHLFLADRNISHNIIVVNQVDTLRFNRAALINIGFLYATTGEGKPQTDYIAMHDVDLLPLNPELPYQYPEEGSVMHVAGPGLHPKYNYPSFIGGILLVRVEDFQKVNGMSNLYWGWGMEDDEFYVRLKNGGIQIKRPEGLTTGMKDTFRHIHSPQIRPRDTVKCFDQYNRTRRRDKLTGLTNLNYTLLFESKLTIDKAPVVVLNVEVHCNTQISPWCDCGPVGNSKSSPKKLTKPNANFRTNIGNSHNVKKKKAK